MTKNTNPTVFTAERLAALVARVVRDICLDTVTAETVAVANAVNLFVEVDPILVIAGANLDNLAEARLLALEELERLS